MPKTELDWQFAQSFGTEESEEQGFCEDDIFTALDFDTSGQYIALGDKAGRITVFESVHAIEEDVKAQAAKKKKNFRPIEYKFCTEFQSHEKGFDRLHSVEIEESINMIRWWPAHFSTGVFLLSTNDTTVKLWKIAPHKVRKKGKVVVKDGQIKIPPPSNKHKTATAATMKRQFTNAHGTCHIDSLSICTDGETFISTDALKINLWHVENGGECYNIVNIKPDNLADLCEVITSAVYHPVSCAELLYSTSLGTIRLHDMRQSALLTAGPKIFQTKKGDGFFSEVVESISDAKFTPDGRFIVSRDYLTTKVWDVRQEKQPLQIFTVHDYLEEYLTELHQNDCIFDKFEIAGSPDSQRFVTGSYDSNFVVHTLDAGDYSSETIHATSEPVKKKHKKMYNSLSKKSKAEKRARVAKMDFAKKSLHVAWHPKLNAVAVASLNKVYIYQAP